jgi:PhnB protein
MPVKAIPQGFSSITPHLVIKNAGAAIDFYKKAFGAEEIMRMSGPDGKSVMHAELKFGNSIVMIADEFKEYGNVSPQSLNGTPVTVHLYVENADASYQRAVSAGATATMPPANMPWGDRFGKLKDPYGHEWSIATHVEDVSPEECKARMAKAFCKPA